MESFKKRNINLKAVLVTAVSCLISFNSFGYNQIDTLKNPFSDSNKNKINQYKGQKLSSSEADKNKAIWILRTIVENSDSTQISPLQRDSIFKFLSQAKISDTLFTALVSILASMPGGDKLFPNNQAINFLNGDKNSNTKKYKPFDPNPAPIMQAKDHLIYGNSKTFLPDKLPIPERDGRSNTSYLSQQQLNEKMLNSNYFSKGIDGYYDKLIAMGYIDQGWIETQALREAIERTRTSIMQNLRSGSSAVPGGEPSFISNMCSNKNIFLSVIGYVMRFFNNSIAGQIQYNSPGYKSTTNYLLPIITPPTPRREQKK